MDLFKQHLAPIAEASWEEINDTAEKVLKTTLSARKVLHVEGPEGLNMAAIPKGTLSLINEEKINEVASGLYDVDRLLESRITFELSRWELDNILRGKKDPDLDALEDAAEMLARYEEDTIYNGNKKAGIKGLVELAPHKLSIGENANATLQAIAEGILLLQDAYTEKPFTLVVGDEVFKALNQVYDGKLLCDAIENLIGGKVVRSKVLEGALLLPDNHPDLELTIGQDYTIGYTSHTDQVVRLFMMNSFTFRVLDEALIVYYKFYKK